MAPFVRLCVFALLAVLVLHDENAVFASKDVQCKTVTVVSTRKDPTRREIRDNNFRRAEITSVNSIESLGEVECRLGKNFFWTADFLYVEDGCNAKIDVCYRPSNESEISLPSGCKTIQLLSRNQREDVEAFAKKIDFIDLEDQYERSVQCEKGRNYGVRDKIAFANNGCRGRFKVCFKETVPQGSEDCDFVLLRSSQAEQDQYTPTDDEGRPASVVSVDLVKELSDSKGCREWRTFSFSRNVVTAKRGCRGRFKVCYRKMDSDSSIKGCITVYLKSKLNEVDKKKITDDNRKIRLFELSSQGEGTKCIRNKNYGIQNGEIYASGGCRGYFRVCVTDSNLPEGPKIDCVNAYVASWGPKDADWTKVTAKDGQAVKIKDMTLIREDSREGVCRKRMTYFVIGNDEVHATNGCKAKIRVCYELKS